MQDDTQPGQCGGSQPDETVGDARHPRSVSAPLEHVERDLPGQRRVRIGDERYRTLRVRHEAGCPEELELVTEDQFTVTLAGPALPEHEIEIAVLQAAMQVFTEPDGEFEIHTWMPAPEFGEYGRKFVEYQVVGRAEPHATTDSGFGEVALGSVVALEDLTRETEHRAPVGGQLDGMGVAHEQSAPRNRLEFGDMLTHGGLPQAKASRRRRETAFAFDGEKTTEVDGIEHPRIQSQSVMTVIAVIGFSNQPAMA